MTAHTWVTDTWSRVDTHSMLAGTNLAALRMHASRGAEAALRLQSYSEYLTAIRRRKATTAFPPHFEADVAAQARSAAADARELMWRSLSVFRQLRNAGLLDQALDALSATVRSHNSIDLGAAGDFSLDDQDVRQVLSSIRIGERTIGTLHQYLTQIPIVLRAGDAGAIRLDDLNTRWSAANAEAQTLGDALRAARFDAVVDELGSPRPWSWAPPDVHGSPNEPVDFYNRIAAQACVTTMEFVRHARKIEDVGLATYEGNLPGALLFIVIVGGLMIVAGTIILIVCAEDKSTPESTCKAGWTLITLGATLIFKGLLGAPSDPGTQGSIGGQPYGDDAQVPPPDAVPR